MNIDSQTLEDHQVKLTVEFNSEVMESAKRRAARKLAKRIKIPGFRPGKAPYDVVVRYAGEGAVAEEGLEILINEQYPKIIEEADIEPYGPGSLENVLSLDPPKLEFLVPLDAEVELGDYHEIRHPYEPKEITDEDVQEVVSNLREQQAAIEPVERAAQEGDVVTIKLSAERKEPDEEQDANLISERSIPVLISENGDDKDEWPYPGFSRNLITMQVGDESTILHQFSEESDYESLRGVKAEIHFEVELVRSRTLPELDDSFASSIGEYETIAQLDDEIRESLVQQNIDNYNEEYDDAVIEEIIAQSTIKYPPQMLERQIDNVINNLEMNLEQQNLDMDLYLKSREMSLEDLREEMTPTGESRLKSTLVLVEVARLDEIQVDQEQLQRETQLTLEAMNRQSEADNKQLSNDVMSNLVGNIMTSMIANQSMERLRDISSGKLAQEQDDTPDTEETADDPSMDNEIDTSSEEELVKTPEAAQDSAETETEPESETEN